MSPSEFIVPYNQYMESVKINYSVGIRFKMRFEGEEAPEQRFTGTIVGIEDFDSSRWPGSKWRCLKVRWDETSSIPRPERVSPWKIEPALAPQVNPLPVPRPKRTRTNVIPSSPDSSVLARDDTSQSHGMSRVLPGQVITILRSNLLEGNESEVAPKPVIWPSLRTEARNDASILRKLGSENWIQRRRPDPAYMEMLSGFQKSRDSHPFSSPYFEHNSGDKKSSLTQFIDREGELSLLSDQWSLMSSNPSSNLECSLKIPTQAVGYGGMGRNSSFEIYAGEQKHPIWFTGLSSNNRMDNLSQSQVVRPQSVLATAKSMAATGGSWKIFGFNLNSGPPTSKPVTAKSNANYVLESCAHPTGTIHRSPDVVETGKSIEPPKSTKSIESPSTGNDLEKGAQPLPDAAEYIPSKVFGSSTGSCIKVHKQGIALGKSVDLSRFNGYDELIAEVDRIFEFEGELMSPNKNWVFIYIDSEGDLMLIGDDPWQEFRSMARQIYIYTKEEVHKMNQGVLSPRSKETSTVAEASDRERNEVSLANKSFQS